MANAPKSYPNITWSQFAVCNDDGTNAFEDLTRRLFYYEILKQQKIPHSDHNTPGVEVLPVLEPAHEDNSPQKRISFQSKYFEQSSVDYSQIQKSARETVKHFKGQLDLVYLFSNKTLTTTSKGYKGTEKTLSDAGIELHPISNAELLDLVQKHPEIANYFFLPRKVAYNTPVLQLPSGITVDSITGDITISHSAFQQPSIDEKLLKDLVLEKIRLCKLYVLALDMDKLKEELHKLLSYNIDSISGSGALYFYRLLCQLHEGQDAAELLDRLDEGFQEEARWLIDYFKIPVDINADEFMMHLPEAQVFVLDKLFTSLHWECVTELFSTIYDRVDHGIQYQLELYYGLSLFNLQEFDNASEVLNALYLKTREDKVLLYATFSDIQKVNRCYRDGLNGDKAELTKLLNQLNDLKGKAIKQSKQNELIIAELSLESSYNLGLSEKIFLERAIEEYDVYSEVVKSNPNIRFLYGLCLELNGNRDIAADVYSSLDWKSNEALAARYMICHVLKGSPELALSIYSETNDKVKSTKLTGIYLFALYRNGAEEYKKILSENIKIHNESLEDILSIVYFVEDEDAIREIITPELDALLDESTLNTLKHCQKSQLLLFVAGSGEMKLLGKVLQTVLDVSSINNFTIGEVYKALFKVCNKEYVNHGASLNNSEALEIAERIADRFLEASVSRKSFLQIKYLCAGAKQMKFSMLKYAVELFEITKDESMALNIIALLFERNETSPDSYTPYLRVLEKSDIPDHCIAVASAMLRIGREEEADFYAYKALYYLNGSDDYSTFKSLLGFYSLNMSRYHQQEHLKTVRGNMVVMLEESNPESGSEPERWEVCLDSELEFSDEDNRSLGVKHFNPTSTVYHKLCGSGSRQVLNIFGKGYKIVQIMTRAQYVIGYIFRKINEKPDMFKGSVWVVKSENTEELIEQIKALTDRSEQTEALLKAYHFEGSDIGLPIDAFINGDYGRFIDALRMLLYGKDQALYTGFPVNENEEGQKYVPALSTLVLLSTMNLLHVLAASQSDIIIPESYQAFFREQYSKAQVIQQVSPGTLVNVDNKLALIEADRKTPEIWENILQFCDCCETMNISDEERISFKIGEGLTGERFISAANFSPIHLDSLLLAAREKATYLCDDLFFRKIAQNVGIRNLNFVSLLEHYTDNDYVVPIIMELSKTNYLYIPLFARTDDEAVELYRNVLTGEKKKRYYGDVIYVYRQARKRIIQILFGDEYLGNDDEFLPSNHSGPSVDSE